MLKTLLVGFGASSRKSVGTNGEPMVRWKNDGGDCPKCGAGREVTLGKYLYDVGPQGGWECTGNARHSGWIWPDECVVDVTPETPTSGLVVGPRAYVPLDDVAKQALVERVAGRRLIVSVSGGKDSTATCLFLKELGLKYTAVHMNTGWETPETDAYIREVLPQHIGPITVIQGEGGEFDLTGEKLAAAQRIEKMLGKDYSAMVRLCIAKARFPSRKNR